MAQEFQLATRRPEVEFTRRDVQPPASLYVRQGDVLFLQARSALAGVTVILEGRLLLAATGEVVPIALAVRPAADRVDASATAPLAEGFLLHLIVGTIDSPARRGQVYIRAGLTTAPGVAGIDPLILAQGYGTAEFVLAWPPGVHEPAVSGVGMLRSVAGTDPGVGAEISETVPTNARWRIRGMRFTLATSGVGSARRVFIEVDDGTTLLNRYPSDQTQAISLSVAYNAIPVGALAATGGTEAMIVLPGELVLFQGWRIRTLTSSLDGADNFGAPQLTVEEWIEE